MAAASADDSQTNLETSLADDRDDAPPVASTSAAASLPAAPVQSAASTDPAVDKPAPTMSMRSLIVTQDASIIIGKGGQNIAQIRERSGAKVNVSENVAGNPERVLTVSGALDAVARAFGFIVRRINDEPFDVPSVPGSRAVTIRFVIPNARMGSVIGKAGAKIKEIQEASGARLQASEAVLPGTADRILSVTGVADAVHIAVYYIGMVLQEAAERQPLPPSTQTYRQPGFASPMAQSFAVPTQQFGMVAPMVAPMAAPVAAMFPGGGPRGAPLPYPSTAGQPGSQSQQIFVPNELVGAIIGRGGNQINAIRQMSQSHIKIMEPGAGGVANSSERLVVITGSPSSIQAAVSMIAARLEHEKTKLGQSAGPGQAMPMMAGGMPASASSMSGSPPAP